MGRPNLGRHRKFARLAKLLGSAPLARGSLELLWDAANENGDELLGEARDVEALAQWAGKPGRLATALVESGFLDRDGKLHRVHDYWHHAPDFVQKRAEREAERREKGETIRSLRAEAGRKGAEARWQTDGKRQPVATDGAARNDGKRMANVDTLALALAHTQKEEEAAPSLSLGAPSPVSQPPTTAKPKDPPDARAASLKLKLAAAYRDVMGQDYRQPTKGKAIADNVAIRTLLGMADPTEIERRFKFGLENAKANEYPGCISFAQIASQWIALGKRPKTTQELIATTQALLAALPSDDPLPDDPSPTPAELEAVRDAATQKLAAGHAQTMAEVMAEEIARLQKAGKPNAKA